MIIDIISFIFFALSAILFWTYIVVLDEKNKVSSYFSSNLQLGCIMLLVLPAVASLVSLGSPYVVGLGWIVLLLIIGFGGFILLATYLIMMFHDFLSRVIK